MNEETRPDPDKLLSYLQTADNLSSRGKLKIFFGACAGVGKTCAMLNDARQRFKEGLDVVSGIIETHGRSDTALLTEGIPALPRREIIHRGMKLEEFDLDAALIRKPFLLLVDELAHTNVTGSRHHKRWQDVEELLNSGIHVYTTLNVQHLESLNDIVATITGIQVRETVPDTIFDTADDISLIDIPSDEILKRLQEGKVYIATGANHRASEHFFKKSNLIALRELALRRTAERVDAQMALYNAGQGIKEPVISEKILVCVGHDALSTRVVRHAKRIATKARAPWIAVYVETGRHMRLPAKGRETARRNMQLAENMGAQVKILKGNNAAEEIAAYALEHNFTRIVVGKPRNARWQDLLYDSLADKLIRRSESIEISVVPDAAKESSRARLFSGNLWQPRSYAFAVLAVSASTALGFPLRNHIDTVNLGMVYLVGVVAVAARFGLGAAIFASALSVAAFNFFLTEPYYSLDVHDSSYLVTFCIMLATSVLISSLASRLRLQAIFFRERETYVTALYGLTKALSSTRGKEAMAEVACNHIRQVFSGQINVLLPDGNSELKTFPGNVGIWDVKEEAIARWCFQHGKIAGFGTTTMPGSQALYLPLMVQNICLGVLSVTPKETDKRFDSEDMALLETFCSLLAQALQRAHTAENAENSKVEAETEKLRNTLLASVGHDLRTPLTSITGITSALLVTSTNLPQEIQESLRAVHGQSTRLARIVTNLLHVTRFESVPITLNQQPYFIEEVIGAAIARVEELQTDKRIETHVEAGLPLVAIDAVLVEQTLVNLLENALKYAPAHTAITLNARRDDKEMLVQVADQGPGIPTDEEERIFNRFYRPDANPDREGSGLGLAICKAVVTAHGGRIWAGNAPGGGALLSFTLTIDEDLMAAVPEEEPYA